jgi:hypothetical protein
MWMVAVAVVRATEEAAKMVRAAVSAERKWRRRG